MVAITRGGMVPACIVARELNIRVVDTVSVKSYAHQDQANTQILKSPDAGSIGDGAGVLIVDDLVDSGRRWRRCRRSIPPPISPPSTPSRKAVRWCRRFITEVSQDTWIYFPWDLTLQYAKPLRGDA